MMMVNYDTTYDMITPCMMTVMTDAIPMTDEENECRLLYPRVGTQKMRMTTNQG